MTPPTKARASQSGVPTTRRSATSPARAFDFKPPSALPHFLPETSRRSRSAPPLRVLKFGGTSVGNISSISQVVEIVRAASRQSSLVVVVSAMAGVTNRLLQAAALSLGADRGPVAAIFAELREKHELAAAALIHSHSIRSGVVRTLQQLLQEGDRLCHGALLLGEVTPRARDSISSLGERMSAPLLAAALAERGTPSESVEATELVVTDSNHGAADPCMELTRRRCQARLFPLLQRGIVPVVTGFIGATADGALTTLGRGGSDYSATIVGAALDAGEVVIWTDVDGLLTADPRLVPAACTIPEISYREAAELAYFGAKVLHPKTLRAITQARIPLWIRNTFAPQRPGTKITPAGPVSVAGVKALTAIGDVSLISVGGPGIVGVSDVLARTFAATAAVRADVLLISYSSSQNDISLVLPSAIAPRAVEALRREFAQDLAHEKVEHITVEPDVAIVTVVGQNMRGISGIVGRAFGALGRDNVNIVAIAQGSSECNLSFVVAQQDVQPALLAVHREFRLDAGRARLLPVTGS